MKIPRVEDEAWEDLAHIFDPAMETCAFMVGRIEETGPVISEFWPTESTWDERPGNRPRDQGYSISSSEWKLARATAKRYGLHIVGHCHTHPGSTAKPSYFDFRAIRVGELGGVWHLRSGIFTLFDRRSIRKGYVVALPPFFEAYAALGASPATDLHKLPSPEPVGAPPVPGEVLTAARQILKTLRKPAALKVALARAGLNSLEQTEITDERLRALEAEIKALGR
jgi:proteasome lid subunit RPN8/RPN11